MELRLASGLTYDSIVDGPGLRMVIWAQGCIHNCYKCHNPQTHKLDGGIIVNTDYIINEMKKLKLHKGITLSGGEPFLQAKGLSIIAQEAQTNNLDVWCYTGYTYEAMLKNPKMKMLLSEVDVLVDGKFILEERSLNIYYRGSRNQRVIDVPKSLEQERVVLIDRYMKDKSYEEPYKKPDYMFI